MVSSELYPATLATECVEEVGVIYESFISKDKDERLESTHNTNKEEHYGKLLSALMYDYDDQYACSSFVAYN